MQNNEDTNLLRTIANNTASQINELGSVAYFCGVGISLGMNFAQGHGLGSFLMCWLSWINVGYVLVSTS